jgi:hypothetical protein
MWYFPMENQGFHTRMDRFGTEEASRERLKGGWPVIPLPRLGDLADTIMA